MPTFEQTRKVILEALNSIDPEMTDTATICFETGARIGDAINIRKWTYNPDTRLTTYTIEKTKAARVFTLPITATRTEQILTGSRPYPALKSYGAYTYLFRIASPSIQPRTGAEDCTYHFGRYYYIRQMEAAGATPEEIANNLGSSSIPTILAYIKRPIVDKVTGEPIYFE